MRMTYLPLIVATSLFAVAAVAQDHAHPAAPVPAVSPGAASPASATAALFESSCSGCHELAQAVATPMDQAGWKDTIARMVGYGASVTPAQADELAAFLTATHGLPAPAAPAAK